MGYCKPSHQSYQEFVQTTIRSFVPIKPGDEADINLSEVPAALTAVASAASSVLEGQDLPKTAVRFCVLTFAACDLTRSKRKTLSTKLKSDTSFFIHLFLAVHRLVVKTLSYSYVLPHWMCTNLELDVYELGERENSGSRESYDPFFSLVHPRPYCDLNKFSNGAHANRETLWSQPSATHSKVNTNLIPVILISSVSEIT